MIYKSYLVEKNIDTVKENLILFYGENLGLKSHFKRIIRESNKKTEFFNFNSEEIIKDSSKVFNEIKNNSLFGNKKIIFIEQINDKFLEIFKDLGTANSEFKVYLFADILEKRSKIRNFAEKSKNCAIIPCYSDNQVTIKNIITTRLSGYSGLSAQNLHLIIENCGSDRIKLNNEIDKIITYFVDKNIETTKLKLLLNPKINENFDLLKDAALLGNKQSTNKLLGETLLEKEKNIFYINILNQRFNKLNELDENLKKNNLTKAIDALRPPIFWKERPNFEKQALKWSSYKIRKMLKKTYDLELKLKSNSIINNDILLKNLFIEICTTANT